MNIEVSSENFCKKIFWSLLIFEILLVIFDYIFNYSMIFEDKQIRRIFNIAREGSLPTWFSSLQFLMVGLIALAISFKNKLASAKSSLSWRLVSGFFIFLSIDDAAEVHERIGSLIKKYSDISAPSYGWQLYLTPFYAIAGVLILVFLVKELQKKQLSKIILFGLAIYALAIGMDYFEGVEDFFESLAESTGFKTYTISHFSKVIEEFLELFGTTCIVYALLNHFFDSIKEIKVKLLN